MPKPQRPPFLYESFHERASAQVERDARIRLSDARRWIFPAGSYSPSYAPSHSPPSYTPSYYTPSYSPSHPPSHYPPPPPPPSSPWTPEPFHSPNTRSPPLRMRARDYNGVRDYNEQLRSFLGDRLSEDVYSGAQRDAAARDVYRGVAVAEAQKMLRDRPLRRY